ncbi:hypothetical protein HYW42_04405 [Candidatus Daviesbacteria bacterium]|nr:hypothetical protein [Candidatus Daviesbacteria bacterium]
MACGTQARNCGADCGYTGTYCPTAGEVCISNRCLPQPNPPVHVCYPASGLPQDIDLCNNEAAISLAKTNISLKNAGPANACSTHTFRFWIFTNPDYITGPLPLPSGGNNPAEVVYDSGWMTSDLKNFNQVLSISAGLALGYDSILFDGTSYYWRAQAWSESCNLFSALSNAWMFKYTPVDPYLQTTQGDVHTNKEIDVSGGPPN